MEPGIIVGVALLGVVVILLIIAIVLLSLFFLRKLRKQKDSLTEIEKKLENVHWKTSSRGDKHSEMDQSQADSAVFVYEGENPIDSSRNSSNHFPENPRDTVIICSNVEQQVVFQQRPCMSQLIELAQDTCKGRSQEVFPADEIEIKSQVQAGNIHGPLAGRHSSVYLDSHTKDKIFNKGIFERKMIDENKGGEITLSDVVLQIPPGALSQNTNITLGITWDQNLYPKLKKEQALLSPVILCQPSISFQKPVKLTFPHCADKIDRDWKWQILKRSGSITTSSSWEPVTLEDYDERLVTQSRVDVKLHHFTCYCLVGESKEHHTAAKAVKIVAFAATLRKASLFSTKIYCINNYGKEIQDIKNTENEVGRKLADSPVPLLVHDAGGNVVVKQTIDPKGWTLNGDKETELDFEMVWHSCSPNSAYIYKPQSCEVKEIICEYTCHQKLHDTRKSSIKIAAESLKFLPAPFDDKHSALVQKLILLLDPPADNDWRVIAEKIDLDISEIRWIEQQGKGHSPTEMVLQMWSDKGKTIEELRDFLSEKCRLDAASEIDSTIKNGS